MHEPLAIVEAGYAHVWANDAAWVSHLTDAVAGEVVGPVGTVGYRYARRQGARYKVGVPTVARGSPDLAHLTASVLRHVPTRDLARFFAAGGITSTSESCRLPLPRATTRRGLVEFCGIVVGDSENGIVVGAPRPEMARIAEGERRCWRRVCAHLSAIERLRSTVAAGGASAVPEAVLAPDGRVAHAEGEAAFSEGRTALREAALAMVKARGACRSDPSRALSLWRELVAGRWTIVEQFDSDGRRLLLAHVNPVEAVPLRELTPRQAVVVRLVRLGLSGKQIAGELGISKGAVSQSLHIALQKLRLRSVGELIRTAERLERADSAEVSAVPGAVLAELEDAPSPTSRPVLTPAEEDISEMLIDGASNSEIAELRGVAYRTVANQVARLYDKLGVHCRTELALRLAGSN